MEVRGHLVDLSKLERPKIAQPAPSGGQTGQDEKQPAPRFKCPDCAAGARHPNHCPAEERHHNGAQGRGQMGIDPLHAQLGQDGGHSRKERGGKGI